MAIRFECDPQLALSSSSTLSGIRNQIDPVDQWLGDPSLVGVQQVAEALGEFGNAASNLTLDLTARVNRASALLGQLAEGTNEVDAALLRLLDLMPAAPAAEASPEQLALAREFLTQTPRSMRIQYKGENLPRNEVWGDDFVSYLTDSERAQFKLSVRDGKLYDAAGNLFDTQEGGSLWSNDGRAIFVVDQDGNLYASNFQQAGFFHHSSFMAGEDIAGAGELRVVDGKLEVISDNSGHYKPTRPYTKQVIQYLEAQGININDVRVEYNSPS
jgi:hypothetical protein